MDMTLSNVKTVERGAGRIASDLEGQPGQETGQESKGK